MMMIRKYLGNSLDWNQYVSEESEDCTFQNLQRQSEKYHSH